jgi:hypothetical protein
MGIKMRRLLSLLTVALLAASPVAAQTEGGSKKPSEVRQVASKGEGEAASLPTAPRSRLVVSVGPRTTFLKEGLGEREVLWLLGSPSVTLRAAGGSPSVTYEFTRGAGRVLVAVFKDGVLVSSRTETRGQAVSATHLR